MIDRDRQTVIAQVGQHDDAVGSQAIGQDRHHQTEQHEEAAPAPGAEEKMRHQSSQNQGGDQETGPGTDLGHDEAARRDFDEDAVEEGRNPGGAQQEHCDLGCDRLQQRDGHGPHRHGEKEIKERKEHLPYDRPAHEQGEEALPESDEGKLLEKHDAGDAPDQLEEQGPGDPDEGPKARPGRQEGELSAALKGEEENQG